MASLKTLHSKNADQFEFQMKLNSELFKFKRVINKIEKTPGYNLIGYNSYITHNIKTNHTSILLSDVEKIVNDNTSLYVECMQNKKNKTFYANKKAATLKLFDIEKEEFIGAIRKVEKKIIFQNKLMKDQLVNFHKLIRILENQVMKIYDDLNDLNASFIEGIRIKNVCTRNICDYPLAAKEICINKKDNSNVQQINVKKSNQENKKAIKYEQEANKIIKKEIELNETKETNKIITKVNIKKNEQKKDPKVNIKTNQTTKKTVIKNNYNDNKNENNNMSQREKYLQAYMLLQIRSFLTLKQKLSNKFVNNNILQIMKEYGICLEALKKCPMKNLAQGNTTKTTKNIPYQDNHIKIKFDYSKYNIEVPQSLTQEIRTIIHSQCIHNKNKRKYRYNRSNFKKHILKHFNMQKLTEVFELAENDSRFNSFSSIFAKLKEKDIGYQLCWVLMLQKLGQRFVDIGCGLTMVNMILNHNLWEICLDTFSKCGSPFCDFEPMEYMIYKNYNAINKLIDNADIRVNYRQYDNYIASKKDCINKSYEQWLVFTDEIECLMIKSIIIFQ